MFGDSWWTVGIDNPTNAVTTILAVDVKTADINVIAITDVCRRVNKPCPHELGQHVVAEPLGASKHTLK
jgi:hypothetical protein